MKIAVCEDEQVYRELICAKAYAYFNPGNEENGRKPASYNEMINGDIHQNAEESLRSLEACILHSYTDGVNLLERIRSGERYDLILMDIQMPHSDGMDISAKIRELDKDAGIIFITGIKERASEGYRIDAFDYIVKNEIETALMPALERFRESRNAKTVAFTTDEGEVVVLDVGELLWTESERRGTKIVTENSEYYCPLAIGKFTSLLPADKFVEVFKSVFVQIKKIRRIGTDTVIMANGVELPLARRKRKTVMSEVLRAVKQ